MSSEKPDRDANRTTVMIRVPKSLETAIKLITRQHREQERRIARLEGRPAK